jgi:hypothetical protein
MPHIVPSVPASAEQAEISGAMEIYQQELGGTKPKRLRTAVPLCP